MRTTRSSNSSTPIPTRAASAIYFDLHDPASVERGHASGFFAGAFRQDSPAVYSFSARGNLLGGTGSFTGVAGQVFVDGGITPAEGGRYTMTLIVTQ